MTPRRGWAKIAAGGDAVDMEALRTRLLALLVRLDGLDWLVKLGARVGMGLMFAGGAVYKFGHLGEFVAYFQSLGIPAPSLQAPFVATVELLGGLGLILGLGTRISALMLSGTMVVALATAAIPEHMIHANWRGLMAFLYLPEWLLLVLLGWMILTGPGRASVDQRIRARFETKPAT